MDFAHLLNTDVERRVVPGVGEKDCKIAFIGEAPGRDEDRSGKPFVGQAGVLLTRLLNNAGIMREACYITNVVKVRPKNNDISEFIQFAKGGRVSTTSEYDKWEKQLYEELAEVKANVLVPLGNVALYALTREISITKYRGSAVAAVPLCGERKVIPTIHPAAALRQKEFEHLMRRDLDKIAKESAFPDIRNPQRLIRTGPTFDEAMQYLNSLGEVTACDIEVSGYTLSCIGFSKSPTDAMCIPFRGKLGNYWTELEERMIMREVAAVLANPKIKKIFHNAAFDCQFLYEQYGIVTVNYECTMIAMTILCTGLRKSLASCVSLFTDEPFYKDEKAEDPDSGYALTQDFNAFWIYNGKDCVCTHEIWLIFEKLLDSSGNLKAYRDQARVLNPLIYMTTRGLRLDANATGATRESLTLEINEMEAQIRKLVEDRLLRLIKTKPDIRPLHMVKKTDEECVSYIMTKTLDKLSTSPAQRKRYFYTMLELPKMFNKDKKVSTDAHSLRKIAKLGYEEANLLEQVAKKRKLRGSYLNVNIDPDNRLRGAFSAVSTVTGRLGCKKLWRGTFWGEKFEVGLNLMTLPPAFKPYVVADEGCVLFDIDLEQADDRVVAWVGRVTRKKKAYLEGKDPHRVTASLIFGIPYDEISDVKGSSPIGGGTKSQRYWGKQSNHAFNYERGPKQFADSFGIPLFEGKRIRSNYFLAYPEIISIFHARVKAELNQFGTVTSPYGRKRRFFGFKNDEMFREGYSYIPQETVGRKINIHGLIPILEDPDLWALEPLIQCHDSILVQAPIAAGPEAIQQQLMKLKSLLETPIPWEDPFVIPASFQVGMNYGEKSEKNIAGMRKFAPEHFVETLEQLLAEAAVAPPVEPELSEDEEEEAEGE